MPGKGTAAKRHRQSQGRRLRNKRVKTRIRTNTRKLTELLEANSKEESAKQYREISSLLDRAVSKGIIHRNTAARKKHRLHKMLPGAKKAS